MPEDTTAAEWEEDEQLEGRDIQRLWPAKDALDEHDSRAPASLLGPVAARPCPAAPCDRWCALRLFLTFVERNRCCSTSTRWRDWQVRDSAFWRGAQSALVLYAQTPTLPHLRWAIQNRMFGAHTSDAGYYAMDGLTRARMIGG